MNISKREKRLIVIVLVLAIIFVYYIYFLKPYFDDMNELATEKTNKQILIDTNNQQLNTIKQLDKDIAEKENQLEDYSVNLSQGFDQPPVLVYLEKIITENAQKVMFMFNDVSKFEQLEICPITIIMTSTYDNLKIILEEISDGEYFFKVTSLDAIVVQAIPVEVTYQVFDPDLGENIEITSMQAPKNSGMLDVTLSLEYYSNSGEIPSDTTYTFDDVSYEYGGDIFF